MKYEANCLPLNEIIQISNLNSQNNEGCISGSELRNLCEKCAKITKSFVAYPLCCRNSGGVRDWCQLYLDFTLNRKQDLGKVEILELFDGSVGGSVGGSAGRIITALMIEIIE